MQSNRYVWAPSLGPIIYNTTCCTLRALISLTKGSWLRSVSWRLSRFLSGLFTLILVGLMNAVIILTWSSLRKHGIGSFIGHRRTLNGPALCRISSCSTCLSFNSFVAFCNLRMGPCRQLRRNPMPEPYVKKSLFRCFLWGFSTLRMNPCRKCFFFLNNNL